MLQAAVAARYESKSMAGAGAALTSHVAEAIAKSTCLTESIVIFSERFPLERRRARRGDAFFRTPSCCLYTVELARNGGENQDIQPEKETRASRLSLGLVELYLV
jgi:hypothetical protein